MAAFALALCVVPLASGQLEEHDPLTPEERAWIEAHGPIRYAPDPDYPPFEFVDADGVVQGVNIDFLNRMSRNLAIDFEVVVYDNWSAVLEAKRAGEVDLLGSLAQTPEREEYMDFIGPYMQVGEVFYVTDPTLTSEADLVGKKVAVVGSYAAADWLARNRPELDQVPVADIKEGLEALTTGRVDAFFENVPVTGYYIRQNSLTNVRILGEPLYYSPANWGVTKDEPLLYAIVEKGIASIPLGEQTRVFEYWTGYDLGIPPATGPASAFSPVAIGVLGAVAVVGGGAFAWSWTLRRTVQRRTAQLQESRDQLEAAKQDLEGRVQARTTELHDLLDREADIHKTLDQQAKDSHLAVKRLVKTLEREYYGLLRPDTVAIAAQAYQDHARLGDLIQDVGINLEGGVVRRSTVDAAPLFKDAVERVTSTRGKEVAVDVASQEPLIGDRRLLRHAAYDLVCYAADHDVDDLNITTGIDEHVIRFTGDAADVTQDLAPLARGGREMALATFARIVHRHGGDIRVAQDGDDVVIRFNLPPE